MAKTLSIKTGKGLEIGDQKEVKAKIGNGIDFGNDNEVVAKGNTHKAIQVSENGIELKVDNTTAKINEDGELEVVATKPDISAGGGINLETPTGETTTEISVKTDNTTTRINANGEIEAIGTKPDIEAGNGIELNTPVGSTTTTISAKAGNGIEVDSTGIKAKGSDGIEVDSNGIKAKAKTNSGIVVDSNGIGADINTDTLEFDENGKIKVKDKAPNIESGNGIEIATSGNTKTISAKGGSGIGVGSSGISANVGNGLHIISNKIGINANFTEVATPLGTKASNINLHSDGKISVASGGSGGGGGFLYAECEKTGNFSNTFDIDNLANKTIGSISVKLNDDFTIKKTIPQEEIKNYNYIVYIKGWASFYNSSSPAENNLGLVKVNLATNNTTYQNKELNELTPVSFNMKYAYDVRTLINIPQVMTFNQDNIESMNFYLSFTISRLTKGNIVFSASMEINYNIKLEVYAIPKQ